VKVVDERYSVVEFGVTLVALVPSCFFAAIELAMVMERGSVLVRLSTPAMIPIARSFRCKHSTLYKTNQQSRDIDYSITRRQIEWD
jgi:hypothetical protein